jgi:glycosyltransferase involved in cell wall biosynthesis
MSLRILLTCEDYFPHIGGAEVCVHSLRSEFIRVGHSVSVFTNTVETTADETGVVRIPWRFSPSVLWRNVRALWKLIGSHDVIHSTYSFRIAAICAVIARLRGKPLLLTQQGKGIVPEEGAKLRYVLLVKLCQHVSMRLATHITTTSDEITELTAAFVSRRKITLVSNGYDERLFRPDQSLPVPPEFAALSPGIKKFLTIRRLVPKNGIHILVQALGLVKNERQDFHYFAVGEGRAEQFIRSLIAEYGLQKHVTLLGKRSNDTLRPYYQHADLLLIPSSAEARSIACIEAMGMAKPLIVSKVGGLIDLIGRENTYGQLVSIFDSEACTYDPPDRLSPDRLRPLADAIIAFLQDPSVLRSKGRSAAAHVSKEYSWSAITRQYLALYDSLLHGSRHARAQ